MSDASIQTLSAPVLSAVDRCDRCGAQAYVLVELSSGASLQFCGHHWSEYESALTSKASRIVNELHKLTEIPADS